jgi:hypothetical protein
VGPEVPAADKLLVLLLDVLVQHKVAARGVRPLLHAPADCPGRKPPFSAVKRPVRPYKNPIQHRFT